jgi:hypothetical protein
MSIPLAIEDLHAASRKPLAKAAMIRDLYRSVPTPRTAGAQLPCGAGDSATDIAGPPGFTIAAPRSTTGKTTGIATVIAGVALIGLAAAGAYRLVHPVIGPVWAGDRTVAAPASETAAPVQGVGVFTGAYENGLPVYRLPPVQVTGNRNSEQSRTANY